MRTKLPDCKKTDSPLYWRWWIRTERAEGNEVVYGWLPGTMLEEEINALKEACKAEGCEVRISKKGGGEVYDKRVGVSSTRG